MRTDPYKRCSDLCHTPMRVCVHTHTHQTRKQTQPLIKIIKTTSSRVVWEARWPSGPAQICSDLSDQQPRTVFLSQTLEDTKDKNSQSLVTRPSLVPVEPREQGMSLPYQLYSSIEDIGGCLSTVSQTALDQALEGLGPVQQPLG